MGYTGLMADVFQYLLLILVGTALLWFGYTLFFRFGTGTPRSDASGSRRQGGRQSVQESFPGAPRTCPVCSARLVQGERVKSSAFPSMGGLDRLMHVAGCPHCLSGQRDRICPVCGATLRPEEVLIARLFDKPGRSHVHVLGCTRCRGPASRRS